MTLGAIKGKVAVVTDASSGPGLSVAQPFHEEGGAVPMFSADPEDGHGLCRSF